jgi:inosine/xanthosine triphosphate pyrophosphatase family protein
VFADDTGLEIDALGGRPGVYTARWYYWNDGMSAATPLNDEAALPNDEAQAAPEEQEQGGFFNGLFKN